MVHFAPPPHTTIKIASKIIEVIFKIILWFYPLKKEVEIAHF